MRTERTGPNIEPEEGTKYKTDAGRNQKYRSHGMGGGIINTGAHRAFPHSAVLPPIFCHSVDIDVVVVGADRQEVTI